MVNIAKTAIIYPNVILGRNVTIEDGCIIGIPCPGATEVNTTIGDHTLVRAGTYIYAGNIIGSNCHFGNKVNIRELNQIGDQVSIGTLSVIEHHVSIQSFVRIHSQAFIPEFAVLEEACWLGPNVVLTNAKFPKHAEAKKNLKGPFIGKNAKIGANSTILPGVKIGANSLIGAGSLVSRDVADGCIAAGNPASVFREIDY